MTSDSALGNWVTTRIAGRADVQVCRTFEEALSLLNALAADESEVRLVRISKLLPIAEAMFYRGGDHETLFYRWEIESKIRAKDPPELLTRPAGVEVFFWDAGSLNLSTRQAFQAIGQALLSTSSSQGSGSSGVAASTVYGRGRSDPTSSYSPGLGRGDYLATYKRLVRKVACEFPVSWSASAGGGTLEDAKLAGVDVGTMTQEP